MEGSSPFSLELGLLEGLGFSSEGWSPEHPSPSAILKWTLEVEEALSVCVLAKAHRQPHHGLLKVLSTLTFTLQDGEHPRWLAHIKLAY